MSYEQLWVDQINKKYKGKQKLNISKIKEIEKMKSFSKTNTVQKEDYSYAELKNIKDIIELYKIPKHFIAYIDGNEDGQKTEFMKDDIIFYVIDDSTDIVELILNEYYSNYIYLIPKKYLSLDKQKNYKIENYNKMVLISKNERSYKRIDVSDKKSYMKPVHKFVMERIILGKK